LPATAQRHAPARAFGYPKFLRSGSQNLLRLLPVSSLGAAKRAFRGSNALTEFLRGIDLSSVFFVDNSESANILEASL
jgi:hypothetical protein